MSSQVCPICGNTPAECKDWRHCGKHDKQLICTKHCTGCEYKGEPGDVLHCKFNVGRIANQKVNITDLNNQIKDKEKEIKDLFDANKPKKQNWPFGN